MSAPAHGSKAAPSLTPADQEHLNTALRTVADEAKDQRAVDYVLGHESPHMSSYYRETISLDRLKAVTDHVRKWLWPERGEAK